MGDASRFVNENFKNEVFLVTEDKSVKCNGIMLAARSSIIEDILQTSDTIPATQLSDNIPGLYSCLKLLYGGSVIIDENNYKSIYKFGKLFQIQEMMNCIIDWVSTDLPYNVFWEVHHELKKLDVLASCFRDPIEKYVADECDVFLQSAIQT